MTPAHLGGLIQKVDVLLHLFMKIPPFLTVQALPVQYPAVILIFYPVVPLHSLVHLPGEKAPVPFRVKPIAHLFHGDSAPSRNLWHSYI